VVEVVVVVVVEEEGRVKMEEEEEEGVEKEVEAGRAHTVWAEGERLEEVVVVEGAESRRLGDCTFSSSEHEASSVHTLSCSRADSV